MRFRSYGEWVQRNLRLAILVGSTREGRFGFTVARWFASLVRIRPEFDVDVIDLADPELPAVLKHTPDPVVDEYRERLDQADAFVVVTPEYNHGYPAALKQAIDLARAEWQAKPVAFVSYGGMSGGLRAVEQLRQVFAELHAVTVRDCVSFHNAWPLFDTDGWLHEEIGADLAAKTMLDRLAWWGRALRVARESEPYAA